MSHTSFCIFFYSFGDTFELAKKWSTLGIGNAVKVDLVLSHTNDNSTITYSGKWGYESKSNSEFLEFCALREFLEIKARELSQYDYLIYVNDTVITKHSSLLIRRKLHALLRDLSRRAVPEAPVIYGRLDKGRDEGHHISTHFFVVNYPAILVTIRALDVVGRMSDEQAEHYTGDFLMRLRKTGAYKVGAKDHIVRKRKVRDRAFEIMLTRSIDSAGHVFCCYFSIEKRILMAVSFVKNFIVKRTGSAIKKMLYRI